MTEPDARDLEPCECRCHAGGPHATCDAEHDTGATGVVGVPTCSPCNGAAGLCILGHADRAERFVGYACRRHYHWIDRTLVQIEELFALLDDVLLPGPAGGDGRSGTRFGSPAPGRVEVMALTDKRAKTPIDLEPDDVPDLPGTLSSWARVVVEERESSDELTGLVAQSVRVLRRERHWIARQDWIDDYVTELGALHRAVARGVGTTMWPEPVGKCPNCQTDLFNTIGADEITCRRCKSTWAGVHLARLRLIHEREKAG